MTVRTILKEYASALYVAFALGACAGGATEPVSLTGSEEGAQSPDDHTEAESGLVRSGACEFCCDASCGTCAPLGGDCTQQLCASPL